jgi:hypothetical protein
MTQRDANGLNRTFAKFGNLSMSLLWVSRRDAPVAVSSSCSFLSAICYFCAHYFQNETVMTVKIHSFCWNSLKNVCLSTAVCSLMHNINNEGWLNALKTKHASPVTETSSIPLTRNSEHCRPLFNVKFLERWSCLLSLWCLPDTFPPVRVLACKL